MPIRVTRPYKIATISTGVAAYENRCWRADRGNERYPSARPEFLRWWVSTIVVFVGIGCGEPQKRQKPLDPSKWSCEHIPSKDATSTWCVPREGRDHARARDVLHQLTALQARYPAWKAIALARDPDKTTGALVQADEYTLKAGMYLQKAQATSGKVQLVWLAKAELNIKAVAALTATLPRGSFGTTRPRVLVEFRMADSETWPDYAAYCPADKILAKLSQWIEADPNCAAPQLDRSHVPHVLEIDCILGTESNDCKQVYVAWVWLERRPDTTNDYDLMGFARARRQCPGGKVLRANDQVQTRARKKSRALEKLLKKCSSQ